MISDMYLLVGVAFGLGIVHALDADHIAAVSVLSSERSGISSSSLYALQWASGHGLMLITMTFIYFKIGEFWPAFLSDMAERIVGVLLMVLGLLVVYKMQKHRLRLHFHKHEGLFPHAHWQSCDQFSAGKHHHKATLIGGLHGVAGSAPLLLSLPLVQQSNLSELTFYIVLFSAGVFVAMVSFGGVFGALMKRISNQGDVYMQSVQLLIAFMSVVIGVRLVSS